MLCLRLIQRSLALCCCLTFQLSNAQNMTTLPPQFAPTGVLRASINLGNPILAQKNPVTGQPEGVSVDLATELAR